MEHILLKNCPACESADISKQKTVKDHFLSQENFDLYTCTSCHLLFTNPRPALEKIGTYYKSEDYVSHSSTKKGLVNRVYNSVRSYTLNGKLKLIRTLSEGKGLLDIGAGTGHFVTKMKSAGYEVTGLEPDEDARAVCAELNRVDLLPIERLYAEELGSFDVITMWHVLEHVYNLRDDLKRISGLLNQNGVLVIAVPNHTSFDAEHYDGFWAAYDVPRHLYHFDPSSIIPMVEGYGLKFEKMLPMKFDSYYVSMLSEKYKGGSLMSALKVGWKSNRRSKGGKCSSQIYIFRNK